MSSSHASRPLSRLLRYSQAAQFTTSTARHEPLPSIAPKCTINIKHIRQNPELYSQNCIDRNYKSQSDSPFKIVRLFDEWRTLQRSGRGLREKNNEIRTKLSHAKTFSGREADDKADDHPRESHLEEARDLKQQIGQIEAEEETLTEEIQKLASELPNLTSQETPIGREPKIIGYINHHPESAPSSSDRIWRNHVHIGNDLDLLDFAGAATTSGWGWYYLKNEAALLEQALIQYALSVAMKHGFTVISPPSMVYSHISSACGFRPRDQNGEQQVYTMQQSEKYQGTGKPDLSLAGTAEIPFASMKANTTMEETEFPLRIVGSSRCYRAEAGARGSETKGLYRVHEFSKVEMFGWTLPEKEVELFDSMLSIQKEILQNLGLHCRVLEMPSTDLGASAVRKQDIEAFFPSRREKNDGWGEVTSTSMCTDYQTRRLATRFRSSKTNSDAPFSASTAQPSTLSPGGSKTEFPSTVNGTALAVPRIIAALLELNWSEKDATVAVPSVLAPWMHGIDIIKKRR
ncbi:Serine--tRNA ligase, mitochondrial [Pseudocyphellaria aurata]|nr:Serine--tRNA ligase, mitochondrial [Pseudocyphellaria aurata]